MVQGMKPATDRLNGLRRIALADLERGMRLAVRVQDDIDPQFRFATPQGDVAVSVTFPPEAAPRRILFDKLRMLCAWKQVLAYTMTFGIGDPNALMTVGVSREGVVGCLTRFDAGQEAITASCFGAPVWVEPESIDEAFSSLLPKKTSTLSDADLADLEAWFGQEGRFPCVHLPTGTVGI